MFYPALIVSFMMAKIKSSANATASELSKFKFSVKNFIVIFSNLSRSWIHVGTLWCLFCVCRKC